MKRVPLVAQVRRGFPWKQAPAGTPTVSTLADLERILFRESTAARPFFIVAPALLRSALAVQAWSLQGVITRGECDEILRLERLYERTRRG